MSLWVKRKIKAFKKSVGTSLDGREEQVTGLFLALEARKKQQPVKESAQKKLSKVGMKEKRELKNLLNSQNHMDGSTKTRSVSKDRDLMVHQ